MNNRAGSNFYQAANERPFLFDKKFIFLLDM